MKKTTSVLLLLFKTSLFFSQTTQLINESGFKHNYVVGPLQFIEDAKDTARLKYIATLKVSDKQSNLQSPAAWFDLIKGKAKESGANSYLVSEFLEDDNSMSVILKFYFAGQKFLEQNKQRAKFDSVILFNQTRHLKDTASFYLNDKQILFDPLTYFVFETKPYVPYYVATSVSNVTAKKILIKKVQKARFFIIPSNKSSFVLNRSSLEPNSVGIGIGGIIVTFGRNAAYELGYDVGRFLFALYSLNKVE
ncbi:MAG: hypothetical protein PSX36_03495 [bacterium]|nr:hypothetical protein [bacterium]